ncbi:hypothetical protein [Kribbella swartbergensis]
MVASYAQLTEEQARAAVKVTGAHHSSWNQKVELLAPEDKRRGLVKWDHTIQYHPQHVVEVLEEMFDRAGQRHDEETLKRYREALRVVFHENVHLLAAAGTSHALGVDAYQEPANQVLEEATTELAAQNALDDYIRELDLEAIAPGITAVRTEPAYGQYVPAVKQFGDALGRRAGVDGAEVVRRMAVVNAENKFRVAADLMYDANNLSDLVPEPAKAAAVARIATAMKRPFEQIHDYDAGDPQDVRMSALAGVNADREAYKEVRAIATYWSENQDLRRSMEAGLGAAPPPRTTDGPAPSRHQRPRDPNPPGADPRRRPPALGG